MMINNDVLSAIEIYSLFKITSHCEFGEYGPSGPDRPQKFERKT